MTSLQVLVSTTPLFTGTTGDTTICQGQSLNLVSDPTAVTWSALPESNLGDGIFLPDLQGVPFNTSITITNFAPGQTLTDPNDLLSVCASMEHSYMGDLVIQIACPNGQTTVFHQQGGGGTYIGIHVDDESETPGTCWEYCWSPTATNGTWVENAGGTIPAGTYESVQPFSNLIGCPLNGQWTFTITDLFAIDNGYICDWSITFNPDLFPSLTVYTPVLGQTSQFSRRFMAVAGENVKEYVTRVKLERSKEMLRTINLSITEIAYQLGYTTPFYFTNVFTKHYGISPSAYRSKFSELRR